MDAPASLIDSAGKYTPIDGEVTIGRVAGVTLWLDDPAISRRHAAIRPVGSGFEIEDLGSANGTYVNDLPVERPVTLHSGDRITIGTTTFTFSLPLMAPDPPASEVTLVSTDVTELLPDSPPLAQAEAGIGGPRAPNADAPRSSWAEVGGDRTIYAPIPEEAPAVEREPIETAPSLLQLASRVAGLVRETDDLAELLRLVARLLAESYRVETAGFYLAESSGAPLACVIAAGTMASSVLGTQAAPGRGAVGRAAAENRSVRLGGAVAFAEDSDPPLAGLRSILAAPISLRAGVVCVLALVNPTWKPAFDDDDLDFATLLGQQLASAAPARETWDQLAQQLDSELRAQKLRRGFVTQQPALSELVQRSIELIAGGQPVYLCGEPGVGRRHLARIANTLAGGESAPFVEFDCRAVPGSGQLEAVLGAGGAWERAASGMLYLAHSAFLEPDAALAMPERLARPDSPRVVLGGAEPLDVASVDSQPVLALVGDRSIHLPPLRERTLDVAPLVRHFAGVLAARFGAGATAFDAEALQSLGEYDWPGNVPELAGIVLRAVILGEGSEIDAARLAWLTPDLPDDSLTGGQERERSERTLTRHADLIGDDQALREAALAEVRQLSAEERTGALGLLLSATESAPSTGARADRLALLARAGDSRIARYAAAFLDDPEPLLRQTAVVALGEEPSPEWILTRLRGLAADGEPETAGLALLALGRLHDPGSLVLLRRALLESDDARLQTAAAAAIGEYDPSVPEVRPLWAACVRRAEVLPARVLTQALGGGVLAEEEVRRLLTESALSPGGKARVIRLVGQAADSGSLERLAGLASLTLDEVVQAALAEQIARRGQRALPLLPRMLGSSQPAARVVGALVLRQLPAAQLAAALSALGDDPSVLEALRELGSADPEAIRSTVAEAAYADWRVEPLLQMLRLLPSGDGG